MTWIAGGGARRTVDNRERALEYGREGKGMVEAALLYFAVRRRETSGGRRRLSGGSIAVGDVGGQRHD